MAKEKADVQDEPTMADVLSRMTSILEQNAVRDEQMVTVQREQLKQTRRRNNLKAPGISHFNPQGEKDYPMPRLKCRMRIPYDQDPNWHGCTWEEVELLNRLVFGEYRVSLIDGTTATLNIIGQKHPATGEITLLEFRGAMNDKGNFGAFYSKEMFRSMPPLVVMLRDMLTQKGIDHADVLTMAERRRRVALPAEHESHLAISLGE